MKKKLLIVCMAVLVIAVSAFSMVACGEKEVPKAIGVQGGTTGEFFVKGDEGWGFAGLSKYDCKAYDNGGLAVKDMINNGVKYVILDEAPAKTIAKGNSAVKVVDVKLTVEEYAFGVDKAQPELLASINETLAAMKVDGTFDAIMNKYFNGEAVTGVTSATKDVSKADKQLVIATNAAFMPFEGKQGDKFVGIDMEIAKVIADKLGLELVIEDMDFNSVVSSVGKNAVDVAMSGLTVNPTRAELVNFSNSYYDAAQVLIVKADDTTFDGMTAEQIVAELNK